MASPSPSPSSSSVSASDASASPEAIDAATNAALTPVQVAAWGQLSVPIQLRKGESATWQFKTAAHDIQFSASFVSTDGAAGASSSSKGSKPLVVSPPTRIAKADQLLQHGSFVDPEGGVGTLTLLFDNTYSKLRGKTVLYSVTVATAAAAIPFGEVRLTAYGPAVIEGVREADGIYMVQLPYGQGFFHASSLISATPVLPPRTINQRAAVGVQMFFNNKVWDAEDFFRRDVERFPVFSLAYGSLGFLRALMTWQKVDIAEANARLRQTRHFVSALLPSVSALKSVGRFLSRSTGPALTPEHLEYTLIQAEAYLLQAMLLFTEESYMSYIKAGLRIRSAWKLYQKCEAQIAAYDPATRAALDPSVAGGVRFGIGSFNIVISTLPSIILRVVSALGFPSDRTRGLELLQECSAIPGVRQPLAQLVLLFVHVVIPGFFTVRPAFHVAEAEAVLATCFKSYPNGALFLWMQGRSKRMQRDLVAATASFERSAAGQPLWAQLQHLCAYELGWCHFFSLEWAASGAQWSRLERENSWSRAFFIYMEGVCLHAAGSSFKAAECFARVDAAIVRKFGGKALSVEAFVSTRAQQFIAAAAAPVAGAPVKKQPTLAALEIVYLFSGFNQMPDALLERALEQANRAVAQQKSPEEGALPSLIQASILKGLRRWSEAKTVLTSLADREDLECDKYIIPFARFELGALLMEQVCERDAAAAAGSSSSSSPAAASSSSSANPWEVERLAVLDHAHALLKRAEGFRSEYSFKNRLHLRIHLACVEVALLRGHWSALRGNVQSDEDLKGAELPADQQQQLEDSDDEKGE